MPCLKFLSVSQGRLIQSTYIPLLTCVRKFNVERPKYNSQLKGSTTSKAKKKTLLQAVTKEWYIYESYF